MDDEVPGKREHQRALETANAYISRPNANASEANLARCYKHNRNQIAQLRARVKELESARAPTGRSGLVPILPPPSLSEEKAISEETLPAPVDELEWMPWRQTFPHADEWESWDATAVWFASVCQLDGKWVWYVGYAPELELSETAHEDFAPTVQEAMDRAHAWALRWAKNPRLMLTEARPVMLEHSNKETEA